MTQSFSTVTKRKPRRGVDARQWSPVPPTKQSLQPRPAVKKELLPFPFVKGWLDPDILWKNLLTYQPTIVRGEAVNMAKNLYSISPLFDGESVEIRSGSEEYESVYALPDIFTEDQRVLSRKQFSAKSSWELWNDPTSQAAIVQLAVDTGLGTTPQGLREAIYQKSREPGSFKVTWVMGLLDILNPEGKSLTVLDPCAGWGDRLIGCMAKGHTYHGMDPNVGLEKGHSAAIQQFGNGGQQITYAPFEDVQLNCEYDLVLTSPPFWDLEIYPGEGQSTAKFPRYQQWVDEWLLPALTKMWSALKPGGHLAIHYSDLGKELRSKPMLDHVEMLGGCFRGVISLAGERGCGQPVFVWSKPTRELVADGSSKHSRSM